MNHVTTSARQNPTTARLVRLLSVGGWLAAAGLIPACTGEVSESDEPTSQDQEAVTLAAGLDYGGAYGYVNGALVKNPATNAGSCPAGYTTTKVLGTSGLDWSAWVCSRPHQAGIEPLYDFGGMWGYVNAEPKANPATGRTSCPAGYTDQQILGTSGTDWPLHTCYKPHVAGMTPAYGLGGVWGYINDGTLIPNPATGGASCPTSYVYTQVLGTTNVDWGVHMCMSFPTSWDYGGAYGYVEAKLVNNPATGAPSCPAGYTSTPILGTSGTDWPVNVCTRPHQQGVDPIYDFGGMWGSVDGGPAANWITNATSCPAGYSTQQVLGTYNVDYWLHMCYKPHVAGTSSKYVFAGMWGYVNAAVAPNPTTGTPSCPSGFRSNQVLGKVNKDYGVWVCAPVVSSCGPTTMPCGSLAETYAPKVWMHPEESYLPSSVEDFLPNVTDTVISGQHYYVTNQALGCDSCTDPDFLSGRSPAQSPIPIYAEVVNRTQNGAPTDTTDVIYWMFYPYNNGKRVCIGHYSSGIFGIGAGCIGGYSTFGNHVGDWEHVTIRFVGGQPTQIALSQHDHSQVFNYGDPAVRLEDGHPVVFAALGSHGLYADAARHTYGTVPGGDTLNDDTGAGTIWDTQVQVVAFSPQAAPQTGSLAWLNYSGRWGNPKSGCGLIESVSGECVLNDGPASVLPRTISSPALVGIE